VSRHDAYNLEPGTLSSCRVEACAATRRDLGQVDSSLIGVARDEHHLYWLETGRIETSNASSIYGVIQIRRVARLAAP
jgi:hypothetical protein